MPYNIDFYNICNIDNYAKTAAIRCYGIEYMYHDVNYGTKTVEIYAKSKYTQQTHLIAIFPMSWLIQEKDSTLNIIRVYIHILDKLFTNPNFKHEHEKDEEKSTIKTRLLMIMPG